METTRACTTASGSVGPSRRTAERRVSLRCQKPRRRPTCREQNAEWKLALPEVTPTPNVPSAEKQVEARAATSRRTQPPLGQPEDKPRSRHKVEKLRWRRHKGPYVSRRYLELPAMANLLRRGVKRVQRDRDSPLKSPRSAAERKRRMATSYDFQRSAWPQRLAVLLLLARFFIIIFINFRIYRVILDRVDMCPCT